jgi:hypothetical protein
MATGAAKPRGAGVGRVGPRPRRGNSAVDLAPLALIARRAAIIPLLVAMSSDIRGVISSHSSLRSQVVPVPTAAAPEGDDKPSLPPSHCISWSQLLKGTFAIDTVCPRFLFPRPCVAMWEAARPSRFPLTQFKAP